VGWLSLEDVRVVVPGDKKDDAITLREWLEGGEENEYGKDVLKEYMVALLLHDIGHAPFSHALENNPILYTKPFIGAIDHEEITRSLIVGGKGKEGINWCQVLRYYLTLFRLRTFAVEPGTEQAEEMYTTAYEQAEGKLVIVHGVLEEHDVQHAIVGSILKPSPDEQDERIYAAHKLVDSEVDIDRIDHFLRDSYSSGVKLAEYRIRALLQNLLIVSKSSKMHKAISDNLHEKSERPYLVAKSEGLQNVEYLLTARELIFEKVLWHLENLLLVGALNQGVAVIAKLEPFIVATLPFLTDQIMLQMFREDVFVGTTVEGYERVLRGELDPNSYPHYLYFSEGGLANRLERMEEGKAFDLYTTLVPDHHMGFEEFKAKKDTILQDTVLGILLGQLYDFVVSSWEAVELLNSEEPEEPKVIVFSNLRRPEKKAASLDEPRWEAIISGAEYLRIHDAFGQRTLFEWLDERERCRRSVLIIWAREDMELEATVVGLGLKDWLVEFGDLDEQPSS